MWSRGDSKAKSKVCLFCQTLSDVRQFSTIEHSIIAKSGHIGHFGQVAGTQGKSSGKVFTVQATRGSGYRQMLPAAAFTDQHWFGNREPHVSVSLTKFKKKTEVGGAGDPLRS